LLCVRILGRPYCCAFRGHSQMLRGFRPWVGVCESRLNCWGGGYLPTYLNGEAHQNSSGLCLELAPASGVSLGLQGYCEMEPSSPPSSLCKAANILPLKLQTASAFRRNRDDHQIPPFCRPVTKYARSRWPLGTFRYFTRRRGLTLSRHHSRRQSISVLRRKTPIRGQAQVGAAMTRRDTDRGI